MDKTLLFNGYVCAYCMASISHPFDELLHNQIYKLILKNFILLIPFLSITILTLGCSNKPVEKEIRMPMLFDSKEQAEKEAYKFGCEGAHQMGEKWMPCSMHKHNH
jgi:hypothetical protein